MHFLRGALAIFEVSQIALAGEEHRFDLSQRLQAKTGQFEQPLGVGRNDCFHGRAVAAGPGG